MLPAGGAASGAASSDLEPLSDLATIMSGAGEDAACLFGFSVGWLRWSAAKCAFRAAPDCIWTAFRVPIDAKKWPASQAATAKSAAARQFIQLVKPISYGFRTKL